MDRLVNMAIAGKHVREILRILWACALPNTNLLELEDIAVNEIHKRHVVSSFLGYAPGRMKPYPSVLCTSINDEVGHVPPSDRQLRSGDIFKVDFACSFNGFHADSAQTWPIGKVDAQAQNLIAVTKASLDAGIAMCQAGNSLGQVGTAIEAVTKQAGYSVVKVLGGHGIGEEMHLDPWIGHFQDASSAAIILEPGMTICIEPMVNLGSEDVVMKGWDCLTADSSLSAHFEHTIHITRKGPKILT